MLFSYTAKEMAAEERAKRGESDYGAEETKFQPAGEPSHIHLNVVHRPIVLLIYCSRQAAISQPPIIHSANPSTRSLNVPLHCSFLAARSNRAATSLVQVVFVWLRRRHMTMESVIDTRLRGC
jgi:hypothetical protein